MAKTLEQFKELAINSDFDEFEYLTNSSDEDLTEWNVVSQEKESRKSPCSEITNSKMTNLLQEMYQLRKERNKLAWKLEISEKEVEKYKKEVENQKLQHAEEKLLILKHKDNEISKISLQTDKLSEEIQLISEEIDKKNIIAKENVKLLVESHKSILSLMEILETTKKERNEYKYLVETFLQENIDSTDRKLTEDQKEYLSTLFIK